MSRDDWYRNSDWNEQTAHQFETKLRRAQKKNKGQYLRIQASMLRETDPPAALSLLDRYFQQDGERFDDAQAYVDRASALLALGRIDEAVYAYEEALRSEEKNPGASTQAYIELPYLVSVRGMRNRYSRALELLEKYRDRPLFPVEQFMWCAALAIITHNSGDQVKAREFAATALEAAAKDSSGFRYHAKIGLVSDKHDEALRLLRGYLEL